MATITREGAPGKDTIGQIGDICIDSVTLRKFECVAIYTTTTNDETTVEYEWNEIHSNDTGDGSGGNTEDNSAVITELLVKTGSLEDQVEEIDSTLVDVREDILELQEASDIIAIDSTIIEDTHAGILKINEIGGVHKQFTTTGKNLIDGSNLTERIHEGITYTPVYDDDGNLKYVNANGVSTGRSIYVFDASIIHIQPGESYILSGCPTGDGSGNNNYSIYFYNTDGSKNFQYDYGDGRTIEFINEAAGSYNIAIMIGNGFAANNLRFYPMIRLVSVEDGTYEPYTGGIASPNPNYPQEIKKTVVTGVKTHGKNFFGFGKSAIDVTAELRPNIGQRLILSAIDSNPNKIKCNFAGANYSLGYIAIDGVDGTKDWAFSFVVESNTTPYKISLLKDEAKSNNEQLVMYVAANNGETHVDASQYFVLSNIQVEEGTVVTDYQPYQESVIEFSEPITLYGDPDAAVQDILTTKQVKRKYDEFIFNATEGWGVDPACGRFYTQSYADILLGSKLPSLLANCTCSHYIQVTPEQTYNKTKGFSISDGRVQVYDADFADVTAFKNWLAQNPITIVCEVVDPVTEPLPDVDQAALATLKTFDDTTYVEFVSEIQPTFKVESSTTQEGSYVLDLLARTNSVEKQVEVIDDTLVYAKGDILDLEEAFHIPETTDTVLEGSYPGLLKVNEIGGKCERLTTTGKNMLDLRDGRNGTDEAGAVTYTNRGDGSYTRVGTPIDVTGNMWFKGGFSLEPSGNIADPLFTLKLGHSYFVGDCVLFSTTYDGTAYGLTGAFTIENEDAKIVGVRNIGQEVGKNLNDIIYPRVFEGLEDLGWEPYTGGQPSPNPAYPQEIKKTVVTGVKTHHKNFLDCRGLTEQTICGVKFTPIYDSNGRLLRVDAKGTNDGTNRSIYYLSKPYTEKFDGSYVFNGVNDGSIYSYFMEISGRRENGENFWTQGFNGNENLPVNTKYISEAYIVVVQNATVDTSFYPMICKNNLDDYTYEPYTESSMTFSKPIELYGNGDVQDVITPNGIERKYYVVNSNDSETAFDDLNVVATIGLPDNIASFAGWDFPYHNAMCNLFQSPISVGTLTSVKDISGFSVNTTMHGAQNIIVRIADIEQTLESYNTFFANTPAEVVFERAVPIIEPLPLVDQIALNSLLTYNGTTYVEFDCGEVKPTFKGEYGRSKETGYVLESLLNTRSNKLNQEIINNKIAALEATIVSNI